ncbi:hypothetical protein BS78_01G447100 [Paspalum vaginatum]|nr:hypothetical protein BS78_01G447100 [Paspalum vaginatum]
MQSAHGQRRSSTRPPALRRSGPSRPSRGAGPGSSGCARGGWQRRTLPAGSGRGHPCPPPAPRSLGARRACGCGCGRKTRLCHHLDAHAGGYIFGLTSLRLCLNLFGLCQSC